MLILTLLITTIILVVIGCDRAWKYHTRQVAIERDARLRNYNAARILADNLEVVIFGRDYYRAALQQILHVTDPSDQAHEIARSFLNEKNAEGDVSA